MQGQTDPGLQRGTRPAIAVVIPAGPADNVVDTLRSALEYTRSPRYIVVVDDAARATKSEIEALSSDVHVIRAPKNAPGGLGGLFVKLTAGYRHVLRNFSFDVLLRLDADALVVGDGIAEAAAERFVQDERLGLLGSYRVGPDGGVRDWTHAAKVLGRECGWRGVDRPAMRRVLRSVRSLAAENGYIPGAHPLGGAYLHSRAAVLELHRRGWLELPALRRSHLGEDQLFALLTVAAGFAIGDFGGPADPLALRWRGLPAAPDEILARHKLVTHSVRFWEDMGELEIRGIFAKAREARHSEG
jgi:hypothetical protein